MKNSRKQDFLLASLCGLLLALSFPPFPFIFLAFIAFVPLLHLIETRKGGLLAPLYFGFWIYQGASNWWISSWQADTDPYLMAAGFIVWFGHTIVFLFPSFLYSHLRKKLTLNQSLILFPFIWTAFEWGHSLSELSYPWLSVGYSQIYNLAFSQIADIGGVWLISFLLAASSSLVYFLIVNYKSSKRDLKLFLSEKSNKIALSLLLSIIILPNLYGLIRISQFDYSEDLGNNNFVNIAVIQPAINPWHKWSSGVTEQIEMQMSIGDSLISAGKKFDLAIWSETAIPFLDLYFNSGHNFGFLREWTERNKIALITGFVDLHIYQEGETIPVTAKYWSKDDSTRYDTFNSALLIDYKNPEPQIYHKAKLTPFAERLPHAEIFTFAMSWFEWGVGISSWGKGTHQFNQTFAIANDTVRMGTIICIESIYPDYCRKFTQMGANVLSVITNDAWYDYTPGPEQHYLIAAMRAIENKRYLARCANTGVSGFISPTGKTITRAREYERTASVASLPLLNEITIYTRFGDWLGYLAFSLVLLILIYTRFTKKDKI